ncbi:hypothetical protein T484DRAFT_3510374 [Baffinella frigidus]|nr:hypothetical protein T484DRAFT_3510374 [Cryptophyta sp. CCMP2293]
MMYSGMTHSAREAPVRLPLSHHLSYDSEWFPVKPTVVCSVLTTPRRYSNIRSAQPRFRDDESGEGCHLQYKDDAYPKGESPHPNPKGESPHPNPKGESPHPKP